MDGDVQRRTSYPSSLAPSPQNDDNDSDSISLTSTVEVVEDSDSEYVVEDVHAERRQEIAGRTQPVFLVEWANFPLDQCTWEPLDNLPEELTSQWEEKKATQDPRVALEFEDKYKAAFTAALETARHRHRRRNAKRRRLGRPTTSFWFRGLQQSDSEDDLEPSDDIPDREAELSPPSNTGGDERDEADEDNAIDYGATAALESSRPSLKAELPKPTVPSNRVFTFNPDRAPIQERSPTSKSKEAQLPKTSAPPSSTKEPSRLYENKTLSREHEELSPKIHQGSAARRSSTADSSNRSVSASTIKVASQPSTVNSSHVPASAVPATTASSEVATKTLKGRKTPRPTPSVNVFFGGKIPRSRRRIGETEINSNQPAKLYKHANYRRKAELRARERDDQAPDISKIANVVFAPGSNAKNTQSIPQGRALVEVDDRRGDHSGNVNDAPQQPSMTPPSQSNGARRASADTRNAAPPKRSSLCSNADRSLKKAKNVHFTEVETRPSMIQRSSATQTRSERFPEADDKWIPGEKEQCDPVEDEGLFVTEPMDIDSVSSLNSLADAPSSSTAEMQRLSLSTYRPRNAQNTQSIGKKMKFSTCPGRVLDITFDAVPKAASLATAQQWLDDFLNLNCLDISHAVLAETFIAQLASLVSQGLQSHCSGMIDSTINREDLNTVAEHLRVASSGLFVAQARFNLLIFPANCADFEGLSKFGVEPTNPDGVALKYFVFSSANPIFQLIRPSASTTQGLKSRVGQEKVLLFPMILGIQYSALIASSDADKKKPVHFFLAFPERAVEWQQSVASWLSTRERTCKIYTNFDAGSWLAFVEKAKRERGVVIVHEALVPLLRRFPQLSKLLLKYPVNLWHFSESLDLEPQQALMGSEIIPAMSTKLSRLFPAGSVALVTPSFLVSEPQAAYRLFKWFFEVRAKTGNNKLVVAYNITDYLSDLSREKTALRLRLENSLWATKSRSKIAMDQKSAALTDQDLEARQKTWLYVDWWLSQQVQVEVPFSDLNPAIFADRSIDPHDEQSLVNWFGWWSMEHSNEYRKFYVIGSSGKTEIDIVHTLTSKTSRKVPLAQYDRSVVNDPDEAMRIALGKRESPNIGRSGFQSQCFHNDENRIRAWLDTQDKGYFAKLYRFPVSWADTRMAAHYGDSGLGFHTIEQWWNSIVPWMSGTNPYNTFIAFFHTIREEWDPNSSQKAIKPRRHPWIAIWRPVDPHNKSSRYSHGRTELIIWDVRTGLELEAKRWPKLKDLVWMQRALVNYIRIHAQDKNPNSVLERVWLGGCLAHQSPFISTQPADITAEFLMRLIADLKFTLPGAAIYLAKNGFREVALPPGVGFELEPANSHNEEVSDDDCDTRIIFHPPRGSETLQPTGRSKCNNDLFDAAKQERRRDRDAKEALYTYPPTLTWYQKQVAEGRNFEHVLVDEWAKIFSDMGIDKSASVPTSASDDRASQAPTRKGSGKSNHNSAT